MLEGWGRRIAVQTLCQAHSTSDGGTVHYSSAKAIINEIKIEFVTTQEVVIFNTQPLAFSLYQNYPNPFNPSTNISFTLPVKSFVSLKIFDLSGREIATIVSEELSAGNYTRQWDAANMPSGVYFYRLKAGSFTETKKLILVR